jgi:hypothetical protein
MGSRYVDLQRHHSEDRMPPELMPKMEFTVIVYKRFRWIKKDLNDVSVAIPFCFSPPRSRKLWPKTIGEIKDHHLKDMLTEMRQSSAIRLENVHTSMSFPCLFHRRRKRKLCLHRLMMSYLLSMAGEWVSEAIIKFNIYLENSKSLLWM